MKLLIQVLSYENALANELKLDRLENMKKFGNTALVVREKSNFFTTIKKDIRIGPITFLKDL